MEEKIGNVGVVDVDFSGGLVVVKGTAAVSGMADLSVAISVHPKAIMDKIAEKIGGPIPAEVAQFIEDALKLQ